MSFRDLHLNIKVRIVLQFLSTLSTMMIIPYLAIYFAGKIGQTVTGVFLILIILAGVAGVFVSGFWADRIGRRKLMMGSEAAVVVTFVIIAFLNSPWVDAPYLTAVVFLFNMFASNMFGPANQAMIVDCSTPENRKLIYTINYWVNNLAIAVGGIVGAFLFEHYMFELFLVVAGTALVSLLATVFVITETYVPQQQQQKAGNEGAAADAGGGGNILTNYLNVLKDRVFMMYFLGSILTLGLEQQLGNYIGVRLNDEMPVQTLFASFSPVEIDGVRMLGILRTENTLLVVLLAVVVGKLMKRYADRKVLTAGVLLFGAGSVLLGFLNGALVLILAMLILTIGELMYIPIKQACLGDLAPAHARSSYMAVDQFAMMSAMLLGAVGITFGGFVSSYVMSAVYLVMGLAAVVLFRRVLPSVEKRRKQAQQQAPIAG